MAYLETVKVEVWGEMDTSTLLKVAIEIRKFVDKNTKIAHVTDRYIDLSDSELPHGVVGRPCVWVNYPTLNESITPNFLKGYYAGELKKRLDNAGIKVEVFFL